MKDLFFRRLLKEEKNCLCEEDRRSDVAIQLLNQVFHPVKSWIATKIRSEFFRDDDSIIVKHFLFLKGTA